MDEMNERLSSSSLRLTSEQKHLALVTDLRKEQRRVMDLEEKVWFQTRVIAELKAKAIKPATNPEVAKGTAKLIALVADKPATKKAIPKATTEQKAKILL